jgi:hypothetical protein
MCQIVPSRRELFARTVPSGSGFESGVVSVQFGKKAAVEMSMVMAQICTQLAHSANCRCGAAFGDLAIRNYRPKPNLKTLGIGPE